MTKETISDKQAHAMAQVCLDLHDALGCKWGDNPYLTISQLKAAAPVQEPDDSLLLCASDLEHSAIYDNHVEMQACIRAVASRIKSFTTKTAQPAVPDAITGSAENPKYRAGWNECRETMLQIMKARTL